MAKKMAHVGGRWSWRGMLLASTCGLSIGVASPAAAAAQVQRTWAIPAQSLADALRRFGMNAGRDVAFDPAAVAGKTTRGVTGRHEESEALRLLLDGTGLEFRRTSAGYAIAGQATASAPPVEEPASTADIVVTAQKRSERIQDVPIAISAFTQETLDKQKIEAGPDILKAVPNLTFSKSNFAGFNLSIRGIGTKAVSVTTDPGVAVNFNSTTLITNRFFEQEFFDLERIEVLRGPQGTLYGRNATGGVVNIISNKADLTKFDGYLKAEVGNFGSRRAQGAINVPIISEVLGLRLAGAYTNRDGFTTNDITMNRIDGRNLYTTRATLSFKPTSDIRSDLIWERFSENDNRARTAKQLCHRDAGPAAADLPNADQVVLTPTQLGYFSQGCKDGSLYDDGAYGVPNGLSLPYVLLGQSSTLTSVGTPNDGTGLVVSLLQENVDPYADTTQTRDLRRISSIFDPIYRAKANVIEWNSAWNLTDRLSIVSQSTYNTDRYYSTQDYNRFNTRPIFNSSDGLVLFDPDGTQRPADLTPGGYFTDPQLGRSDRLVARDLVTARTKQFSQELRLSIQGAGRLQATIGGNYTYYKNQTDYFVFINTLTAFAQSSGFLGNNSADPTLCNSSRLQATGDTFVPTTSAAADAAGCFYIDPNPFEQINGQGHNYFRSSNRFHLNSFGLFADGTYAFAPELKLIAGLRYNDDKKTTTPVPSQLLLSTQYILAGTVNYGYPTDPDIKQHYRAITGRAGFQWLPSLSFTNDSMLYFTYSRGYKAGGTNPPPVGFAKENPSGSEFPPVVQLLSYPQTFRPEYVNSLELGVKNTLLNNRLTLNLTTYFYSFRDYQVSQIQDRQAINENFDTSMYGLEAEFIYRPNRAFQLNGNIGLQNAKLRNNQYSIDVMNRLQGNGDKYIVVKPFIQLPSNCVVNKSYLTPYLLGALATVCPGSGFSDTTIPAEAFPNGGRGFYANVGGNQVPNAPHFTTNVGAEYNIPFAGDWVLTPRVDAYHQSGSWARVYNDQIDRLRGWENVNVSLRAGNPELGLLIEAYVKNVFDSTPITDAFINSDDTGLTTNVFTFDPRIIGVNVTKKF